ncbi:hypothetical protein EPN44_01810 [bacterium]|nr:MAG: hypothetical protein EPN44_01810 [bacterium]
MRALFGRSWSLYRENPVLAVPALLLQLLGLVWVFTASLARQPDHDLARAAIVLALSLVWLAAYFVAGNYLTAAAFGMSASAWRVDVATLADGAATGSRRWWPLGTLWFLVAAISIPAVVAAYLLFVSAVPSEPMRRAIIEHPSPAVRVGLVVVGLAFWFFTIYTVPAIVLGGRRAFDGFTRSIVLASGRARETVVMLIPLAVVGGLLFLGSSALDGALKHRALAETLFQFADAAVEGLWGAYVTLVVSGRFLELEGGSQQGLPAETLRPLYE